jgi:HD-like signal output (HDOD) protein
MIRNIENIGTAPTITLRILQEAKKDGADLQAIARLIMDDPRISAQVLKVANSPVFAGFSRISTVSQAVVVLGIQNIQQVLFAIELFGVFKGEGIRSTFSEETFWKHSLAGAMIAEKLCDSDTSIDRETAYLAALLRDIGVLAIRQYLTTEFEIIIALMETNAIDFRTASRTILGNSHKQIGSLIAKQWRLPEKIVSSIGEYGTDGGTAEETGKIRSVIDTADAMLADQLYCAWDRNAEPPAVIDLDKTEEICGVVFAKVDELFKKLWC